MNSITKGKRLWRSPLTSDSMCSLCNKKIGTSFAVYPNGKTIVHFVCFRDSQSMKAVAKGTPLQRRWYWMAIDLSNIWYEVVEKRPYCCFSLVWKRATCLWTLCLFFALALVTMLLVRELQPLLWICVKYRRCCGFAVNLC